MLDNSICIFLNNARAAKPLIQALKNEVRKVQVSAMVSLGGGTRAAESLLYIMENEMKNFKNEN